MGLLELDYPTKGDRFPAQINDMLDRIAALERQIAQSAVLPGTIQGTCGATADVGYALIAGQTLTNAQGTNPALWGRAPANWKSGANIILPDARGKFLVMDDTGAVFTLGVAGGALSRTITSANLPVHTHTIDHDHAVFTSTTENQYHSHTATNWLTGTENQNHNHYADSQSVANYDAASRQAVNGAGWWHGIGGWLTGFQNQAHNHYVSGTTDGTHTLHTHQIDVPNFTGASGNGGFGNTAFDITPANLVINWQIKL